MSKLPTLKQNVEFRRMYHKTPEVSPLFILYVAENHKGYNRLGITTGKKIGKAHDRNRARRIIREAYRLLQNDLKKGKTHDFVFVARTRTVYSKTQDVYSEMRRLMKAYLENRTI